MSKTLYPKNPIVIVDDEPVIVEEIARAVKRAGLSNIQKFTDSREALTFISENEASLVLLDLNMPFVKGEDLLDELVQLQPGTPSVIISGRNDVESAVASLRSGAHDYLVKPVSRERLVTVVKNALLVAELRSENNLLRNSILTKELANPDAFRAIVTRNSGMLSILHYIEAVAESSNPVLVTGETGTGKELIAESLHNASGRRGKFVAVNVAGLDDHVFADTLFGHRKGAFTGAHEQRKGMIAAAADGTIFLDEIGDLSMASQVKLLRFMQEDQYMPLGEDIPVKSSARVVAATNADLDARMKAGEFRQDLYYRLKTHSVDLPPLRDRCDDLPLLLDHFLEKSASSLGKKKPTVPQELYNLIKSYDYPGNIREFEAIVAEAVAHHKAGVLSMKVFRDFIKISREIVDEAPESASAASNEICFGSSMPTLQELKYLAIDEALKRAGGTKARAASLLGITRQTLNWHLKQKDKRG